MKARKRFLLLFVAFLTLIHFGINRLRRHVTNDDVTDEPTNGRHFYSFETAFGRPFEGHKSVTNRECRMSSCFDFGRCDATGLRVHVYGFPGGQKLSPQLSNIVSIIRSSNFFEADPNKACLFVTTVWDTVDRDPLSRDFQKPNPAMTSFSPLIGGRNHLVFNLYSGSWPQYRELDFGFGRNYGSVDRLLGNAILVKASQSRDSYRSDFDVSLPLFGRNHVIRGPAFPSRDHNISPRGRVDSRVDSDRRPVTYLLVFKGKRYIYGIGSETRNTLHYLNNGGDVLMVTTCRHGKIRSKDKKCEEDNANYGLHDYQQLMANSTFCLVPRGRRLGSYRFLEALAVGCIPVVLANGWILPFSEIIDWSECAVTSDERLLLQIPETLRQFSAQKISRMRRKCLQLFETYFSSIERIVMTSLQIIEQRIQSELAKQHFVWNLQNPAFEAIVGQSLLGLRTDANDVISDQPIDGFTAIIHVTTSDHNVVKVVARTLQSRACVQVVVIWSHSSAVPPLLVRQPKVRIVSANHRNGTLVSKFNSDLVSADSLPTDCVLQLSPNSVLTSEELEFAHSVWKSFPQRLVGFSSRDHHYNEEKRAFEYSSKWTNQYSMVSTDSALYHKNYNKMFTKFFLHFQNGVDLWPTDGADDDCADLAFAFLVSHVTRESPIKVTQRKRSVTSLSSDSWITCDSSVYTLRIGSNPMSGGQEVSVLRIITHELYFPSESYHDIALIVTTVGNIWFKSKVFF